MTIYPTTLSLIVTHKCTAACEHCCFSCNPQRQEAIPPERIKRYIRDAAELPSMQLVVFTGGECFLLGDKLDECVQEATNRGLKTRFVSNGYWAASPKIAKARLERLIAAGIGEANFSTGDFHSRYVSPENIINGAEAACELGLTTAIMVETFVGSQFPYSKLIDEPRLQRHFKSRKLRVLRSPWMEFSGRQQMTYEERDRESWAASREKSGGCRTLFTTLTITPTERLVACCGLPLEQIPELGLGDLREKSMQDLVRSAADDFIKIWIHMEGPDKVFDWIASLDPTIERPSQAAHICDTCRSLYHSPKARRILQNALPPNYREIVAKYQKRVNNNRLLRAIGKTQEAAA